MLPPTSLAVAWTRSSASTGSAPVYNFRSAPVALFIMIRTLVILTGRPMSTSNPVPVFRFPKAADAYHWVRQAVAALASIAAAAVLGLSPELVAGRAEGRRTDRLKHRGRGRRARRSGLRASMLVPAMTSVGLPARTSMPVPATGLARRLRGGVGGGRAEGSDYHDVEDRQPEPDQHERQRPARSCADDAAVRPRVSASRGVVSSGSAIACRARGRWASRPETPVSLWPRHQRT